MHTEHHKKAESMLLWLDRNPPTVQDCRRAGSKDPGKCFRSLAPVCISVSSAVKFETLNIPPGCTFRKNLNLTFAPGFFPNATQLVCIPVMALVNGPPSMGDRGSMTSQDRPFTAPEEAYIANGPKHLGKNMTKCK